MAREQLTPKAEATRLKLLETGHALVLSKGFAALGLQELLTAAAVPKGSFYHYFPSKEAFGTALLQHYVEDYAARLDALLAQPGSGRDRLLRYWNAWIASPDDPSASGWSEECLVVKLAAEVADLSEDMRQVLETGVTRLMARIAGLIEEARSDGSLPKGADPAALAQVLYQMWLGAALLAKLTRTALPMQNALFATEVLLACKATA
ncbi:MAG: TetR family transcriptional regulator [Sphingobium sp.]|nr:TetR family transcriptional regulator [Sphingobium sp.]